MKITQICNNLTAVDLSREKIRFTQEHIWLTILIYRQYSTPEIYELFCRSGLIHEPDVSQPFQSTC